MITSKADSASVSQANTDSTPASATARSRLGAVTAARKSSLSLRFRRRAVRPPSQCTSCCRCVVGAEPAWEALRRKRNRGPMSKDLRHRPAVIEAASQGSSADQSSMVSYYRPELGLPEMGLVGRQLWEQSPLGAGRRAGRGPV